MKYDLAQTKTRHDAGEQLKYLFFWGHQPSRDGSVTQSCFSQWWEQPFEVEGLRYRTAEHWMMAGKARLFNDEEMLAKILEAKSPSQAKKFGREVRGFDQAAWEAARYGIVLQGNLHKFGQHPDLKDFLLRTGNKILVEASPFDRIWGIGIAKTAPNIEDLHTWKGLNLLGFALMEVRDLLNQ
jgi:ribA/ribD-fused uncharacterized protein